MNTQRQIKFRVWDYDKWVDPKEWYLTIEGRLGQSGSSPYHSHNCIIQQYTGLLDSAGKEIYEGDIVEYNSDSFYKSQKDCIIFWSEDGVAQWMVKSKIGGFTWSLSREFCKESLKIIGNICENPELV